MNWAQQSRPIDRVEWFPTEWALSSGQPADDESSSLPPEDPRPVTKPIQSQVATARAA